MTGKGTKRIARPACVNPRMHRRSPVSAVAAEIAMRVGTRGSTLPRRWITVATRAASTTEMELSGPATANGSELRQATIEPPMAAERNVTATP